MSPLCTLSAKVQPMKWAEEVHALYGIPPEYVADKLSPIRDRYGSKEMNKRNNEMLTTLKVKAKNYLKEIQNSRK